MADSSSSVATTSVTKKPRTVVARRALPTQRLPPELGRKPVLNPCAILELIHNSVMQPRTSPLPELKILWN